MNENLKKAIESQWKHNHNYKVEYDESCGNHEFCAIYFASNAIYFPNTEMVFTKRIVECDTYEWWKCRIKKAYKHIFVRDVFKQWYVTGINSSINSQDRLYDFLKKETHGYKIITCGSSAGGYASVLMGIRLHAVSVFCFNAQFTLLHEFNGNHGNHLLHSQMTPSYCMDLAQIMRNNTHTKIYYIYSNRSLIDNIQRKHIKGIEHVYCIEFNSSLHGVPILHVTLQNLFNMEHTKLVKLASKVHTPLTFNLRTSGGAACVCGFCKQIYRKYKKKM